MGSPSSAFRATLLVTAAIAASACGDLITIEFASEVIPLEVSGVVRSSDDGRPIPGALVHTCGKQPPIGFGWCAFTQTASDGSFEISDSIRPGSCPLHIGAGSPEFLGEVVALACGGSHSVDFNLDPLASLSVTLSPASVRLGPGSTVQLEAQIRRRNGEVVSAPLHWATSAPEVATVDGLGKVTAVATGEATITASAGGKPGSTAVSVASPAGAPGPTAWLATRDGVSVLDLDAGVSLGPPIEVGGRPWSLAAMPGGDRVLVATNNGLTIVDAKTRSVLVPAIPGGAQPRDVAVTPDGGRAYVANDDSDDLSVYDLNALTLRARIPAHDGPFALAMARDGKSAWVAHAYAQEISILDLAGDTLLTQSIPTGPRPQGMALSPDGKQLHVAQLFTGQLITIDVATRATIGTPIPVGKYPGWVALTPDGARALVANSGSKSVAVVDLAERRTVATLSIDGTPWGVAVTPDGATALVPTCAGLVYVLDLVALRLLDTPLVAGAEPNDIIIVP